MGVASRTMARRLIEEGRVRVNNKICKNPNLRIHLKKDKICIDDILLKSAEKIYVALNKPRGLVTTASDEKGRATVYERLKHFHNVWLAPVGRLDKASEGLIFFTNDTDWAEKILNPSSHLPKTYHIQINRHLTESELKTLQSGVILDDGTIARPEKIQLLRSGKKNCWLEIALCEGLNREIRRMMKVIDAEVLRLIRVAIGPIKLGDLPKGETRLLTEQELKVIDDFLSRLITYNTNLH